MRTKIISQDRTETVVSIDDAMEHSRITDTYDELVVQSTLEAATDLVENWLNRKLYPTEMVAAVSSYKQKMLLSYPPIHSVSKVTAEDANGNVIELPTTDYKFDEVSEQVIFRIDHSKLSNFKIYFKCGYPTVNQIPMGIKHAIKQTFATLYENREDTVIGTSVVAVPNKAITLLKSYRVKAMS